MYHPPPANLHRRRHPMFGLAERGGREKRAIFCHAKTDRFDEERSGRVSCDAVRGQFSPISMIGARASEIQSVPCFVRVCLSEVEWLCALCNPVVTFCRTFSPRWNLFWLSKRLRREIHQGGGREAIQPTHKHLSPLLLSLSLLYAAATATAPVEFYRSIEFFAREQRHSAAILRLSYL